MNALIPFIAIFGMVFSINVIPVFAPPTWTFLSYVAIRWDIDPLPLAVVGAAAATLGRYVLARSSRQLVRYKFLSEKTKRNIDTIKHRLEKNKIVTFSVFLFYAFSPFPSNYLFIAYGLTEMPLSLITLPFFIGRMVSYAFWAITADVVATRVAAETLTSRAYVSVYYIVTQSFVLFLVYLFTQIDWKYVFEKKRVRFIK